MSDTRKMTLPTNSGDRKNIPMLSGCLRYFPAALAGIAAVSDAGNKKHNPGEQLHHARGKSMDHGDCIIRHLMDVEDLLAGIERGQRIEPQEVLVEIGQLAWRALALSQELHERFGAPIAPGARLPEDTFHQTKQVGNDDRHKTEEQKPAQPVGSVTVGDYGRITFSTPVVPNHTSDAKRA